MFDQHPLDAHTSAVDATGVDPPAEWTALRGRFNDYLHLESRVAAQLAKAVVSGAGPTEIASLRAQALAVATAMPPAVAEVDAEVARAVPRCSGGSGG